MFDLENRLRKRSNTKNESPAQELTAKMSSSEDDCKRAVVVWMMARFESQLPAKKVKNRLKSETFILILLDLKRLEV
jgi:hypothetical protein